jgi:hypothetical protein
VDIWAAESLPELKLRRHYSHNKNGVLCPAGFWAHRREGRDDERCPDTTPSFLKRNYASLILLFILSPQSPKSTT